MKSKLFTAAGVLAIVAALSLSHLLGPDDMRAEWDQSQALKELQAAEAGSANQQAAAQKLCNQERGPNSEARWLADGSMVCTTRRGAVEARL